MSADLRLPVISGRTEREQLAQLKSYLYQTVSQLNMALGQIEKQSAATKEELQTAVQTATTPTPETTFNAVKSLIIKSADIINSYYEVINQRLEGLYVAQSDFGQYKEETSQEIRGNSTYIEQLFQNIQTITDTLDELYDATIAVNAYIKTGLLYYGSDGAPVYGMEIGQTNHVNGEETFNKFARFTSDRVGFYDRNDVEVAYISNYKLFITEAEITGGLTIHGFRIDTTYGFAIVPAGGGS